MPKPPRDENKTKRFNMFLSPSELEAIEAWSWENKVRSKSEAVRRLIALGLRVRGHASGSKAMGEDE